MKVNALAGCCCCWVVEPLAGAVVRPPKRSVVGAWKVGCAGCWGCEGWEDCWRKPKAVGCWTGWLCMSKREFCVGCCGWLPRSRMLVLVVGPDPMSSRLFY